MRHTLEYNDALAAYICIVCGATFTQDALIAEMDANGCEGPKAEEGLEGLGWVETPTDISHWYSWQRPDFSDVPSRFRIVRWRMSFEDDTETKGRRLLEDAGYVCGDEGGEK